MNKINLIFNDIDSKIEGYNNLSVEQAENLTNGTCEEIICTILDKYTYDIRINLIATLCKKLSNLGFLTLKFINGTKICKDVAHGNSNSRFLSSIINESHSIFLESDMMEIISQTSGIVLHKTFNDNLYLTIVLQKKL